MDNITEWKTTGLGLLMILATLIDLWYFDSLENNIWLLGGFVVGLALILAPDTLIQGLKRLITRKSKEL